MLHVLFKLQNLNTIILYSLSRYQRKLKLTDLDLYLFKYLNRHYLYTSYTVPISIYHHLYASALLCTIGSSLLLVYMIYTTIIFRIQGVWCCCKLIYATLITFKELTDLILPAFLPCSTFSHSILQNSTDPVEVLFFSDDCVNDAFLMRKRQ